MGKIESIQMKNGGIYLNIMVSEEECALIKEKCPFTNGGGEVMVVPEDFDESLTTGKLGNSNRIMVPKKILKRQKIELKGKVPAAFFNVGGKKMLLIKLGEKIIGVPEFG